MILKILLNAGISPIIVVTYVLLLISLTVYVKIVAARGQSAGVRSLSTFEASQRLNAGGLELNLDPNYITGFSALYTAEESSFIISIIINNYYKAGDLDVVVPIFTIHPHIKDYLWLEQGFAQNYFQMGTLIFTKNICLVRKNQTHLIGYALIIPFFISQHRESNLM